LSGHRLLLAFSFLLPMLVLLDIGVHSWRAVQDEGHERATQTAALLREHGLRSFEAQQDVLVAVAEHLRGLPWSSRINAPDVHRFLVALDSSNPTKGGVGLVAPDRKLADHSRLDLPVLRRDLSQRAYVQAFAQAGTSEERAFGGGVFVGPVVRSAATGLPVYTVSSPTRDASGRPDGGVVTVNATPGFLASFYRSLVHQPGDEVLLVRNDGAILGRYPDAAPEGTSGGWALPPSSAIAALGQAVHQHGGALEGSALSPLDGRRRLYAVADVAPYPVFVAFGVDPAAIRQVWLGRFAPVTLLAVLSGAALAGLTLTAARATRRETAALRGQAQAAEVRAQVEERLRRSERVNALGLMAAGLAHDVANMAHTVQTSAELMEMSAGDPARVRRFAALIQNAAERGGALSRRMVAFARSEPSDGSPASADVAEAVERVAALLMQTMGGGLSLRWQVTGRLPPVRVSQPELETSLINLVMNARDASQPGGDVQLLGRLEWLPVAPKPGPDEAGDLLPPGEYVVVEVVDAGEGMTPDTLARVGEAFFTTKPPGRGTGLGLTMARALAQKSGGGLRIRSQAGRGTTVGLWLAAMPVPAEPALLPVEQ